MKSTLRAAFLLLALFAWTTGSLGAAPEAPDQAIAGPQADPPVLVSPSDGATTTATSDPPVGVPTMRWQGVTDATRYHIQVDESAGFSTPIVDKDTYATSYTPEIALADGPYYWRVRALVANIWEAYSDAWSFQKDWSDSGAIVPQLMSPPEGASRAAFAHDDFSWTPVPGAATYRLEISADASFSNIAYTATTIKARHTPTQRLANNLYYWRVIPFDRQGHAGTPSQTGSFTFNWDQAPQLLNPLDNVDVAFLPRFSWTAVEAAKQYRLEISTQPDFGSLQATYTSDHTDLTPEQNLSNDQDYYWRVQAADNQGTNSPYSEIRRFRTRWNFQAQLLTPLNNSIRVSYPFFSWAPIPGAERYQLQIDESTSFDSPIADETIYNVTTYVHPQWTNVFIDGDYFWRVRGIDARGNVTPWSSLRSFRPSYNNSPTQVYPLYYYTPDEVNTPIHADRSIKWPVFVWDTAHRFIADTHLTQPAETYLLTVDDDPAFGSPNFQIETTGNGAAPTAANPLSGLVDGKLYYWRVRAYRGGVQMGTDSTWVTRYDANKAELPESTEITPIYPADGFEAVGTPPVLGWQPLQGAGSYRVQISTDAEFTDVVDEAQAQFVNYVPWQGRSEPMPFGTYWWRVRDQAQPGAWSEPRRFNLSVDLMAGNPYDSTPAAKPGSILTPTDTYDPSLSYVDASPAEPALGKNDLSALHIILDRTYTTVTYNWVIAFESAATSSDSLVYGIYFDIDHMVDSGGTTDPLGKPISVGAPYLPEYVLYLNRSAGDVVDPANATFYSWNGAGWNPPQTLADIGGDAWVDTSAGAVQALVPYTAIGAEDTNASGSVAMTVFSTSTSTATGALDTIPEQGSTLDRPAFVSDMLMPLYPFDTPLSNPIVHYDMPTMRWRMPLYDSVDGYQVEVARDSKFTDIVETWESYETQTWPYYALMPAAFATQNAYEDNESYYWRARIRHERFTTSSTQFDYGPWSPPMRFKLDSRQVGNPTLSTGGSAYMTPTFSWDRVEGASGYTLQVDNDSNFSSPLINKKLDGTSYTPLDAFQDGTYYWRVAMRRSSTVVGHWTTPMAFTKQSPRPELNSPEPGATIHQQPTFMWTAVFTPTATPRLAAPRYRVQVASDPNFSSPRAYDTDATTYTPVKTQSLADGTWYWRAAVIDANTRVGPYSPVLQFYKEYLPPVLLRPIQGTTPEAIPSFEWSPVDGAAYYRIQIANNELFNGATTVTTDNTRYTPTSNLKYSEYYWRVQIYDSDGKAGPYILGRVKVGSTTFLPLMLR